ncbi:tRNA epoxyqueuosine(34) reductase QueG [Vibrio stylophorae]|uniref:tRNA epoxyqueuosine(34) reductase QueG n=1 Tax=Vibrio stylophorae TaxID=659351 RepID=UPI001F00B08C|nr:tRNA epoxyqueuosine(34) reductase QueG [Vibrio stylophorae]
MDYTALAEKIKGWGKELGLDQVGICDVDLSAHEPQLLRMIEQGYFGEMDWMARHGTLRARPDELLPGAVRVISARLNYLPPQAGFADNLNNPHRAYISRYALGRDYHKLMRNLLKKLGQRIEQEIGEFTHRPFVDSAPILERPLAQKAGLGWTGKHSLILNENAGSWFFLGELLISLPLPVDTPHQGSCGNCVACMTSCPTQAIVEPFTVDARRCISYLTIEFDGVIPEAFRRAMGNRIYGCDDCQLVCPHNRQAPLTEQKDFHRREALQTDELLALFLWTEAEFMRHFEGSAIRRIGHLQWLRNLSIAMGNAPYHPDYTSALESRRGLSDVLDTHLDWAINEQQSKQLDADTPLNRQTQRLIRIVEKGLPRDA